MSNVKWPFWKDLFKLLVDRGDGTHAERVEAYPPAKLMTDGDGPYARMRVDVGQTGFFAGREARTFYEFSIPTGATRVIKISTPINIIITSFTTDLELAELKISYISGGTEGGTYNTTLPTIKVNTMTTASNYVPQVICTTGGTHTGGTIIDIAYLNSGANAQKSIQTTVTDEYPMGYPAGTYYVKLENTDGATATGAIKIRWEERP